MTQGIIAGMTDYSDQNLSDIAEDISSWIEYCEKTKEKFESNIAAIKKEGLWESTVPYDFQNFCLNLPETCETYIHDFKIVLKSVEIDCITQREIKLMRNLWEKAHENERWCVEAYKYSEPDGWCDFGTPEFEKIEELYAKGRDFYVTMFDTGNVAARMEDYMKKDNVVEVKTSNEIKSDVDNQAKTLPKYDVFLSHANADKQDIVDELNNSLEKLGINIFYDKKTLEWGDKWKNRILDGTKKAEFAIIVISDNFFGREWTENELNEFLSRQNKNGQKLILPIIHNITYEDLREKYPNVAEIQAINSKDHTCDEIALLFAKQLIQRLKSED